MPIFEYACEDCGERFEFLTLGSEKPVCPKCGGAKLEKQFSAFAVGAGKAPAPAFGGGCGTCGDPRGPGACQI